MKYTNRDYSKLRRFRTKLRNQAEEIRHMEEWARFFRNEMPILMN